MGKINRASIDNRIDLDVLMKQIIPAINDNNDRIERLERFAHPAPVVKEAPAETAPVVEAKAPETPPTPKAAPKKAASKGR